MSTNDLERMVWPWIAVFVIAFTAGLLVGESSAPAQQQAKVEVRR